MARRIEESDGLARLGPHFVGSNVLRDAARFALGHARVADVVEQRSFAVVDVTHNGHDRRTRPQIFFNVAGIDGNFLLFGRQELYVKAKLVGNHSNCFRVEALVDGHEHAHAQAHLDDLVHIHVH